MDKELYNSLRSRKMLDILDGDTGFGIITIAPGVNVPIQMPYLTARDITNLSHAFGFAAHYDTAAPARKAMLDDLITCCILNERTPELLDTLFSEEQFHNVLGYVAEESKDAAYQTLLNEILIQINHALEFDSCELVFRDGHYLLEGAGMEPKRTILSTISQDTVKDTLVRAENDLSRGEPENAVSKARTLTENALCYAIEKAGGTPENSKSIEALYSQFCGLYSPRTEPLTAVLPALAQALSKTESAAQNEMGRLYLDAAIMLSGFVLSEVEAEQSL